MEKGRGCTSLVVSCESEVFDFRPVEAMTNMIIKFTGDTTKIFEHHL